MAAVAVAGVVLGIAVEVPRLRQRWEYCQKQVYWHSWEEENARAHAGRALGRYWRLTAITRNWRLLPTRGYEVSELIEASGDPALARWLLTPGKLHLLGDVGLARPVLLTPEVAAGFLESHWGKWWRDEAEAVARSAEESARMAAEFHRAAYQPWLPVPAHAPYYLRRSRSHPLQWNLAR
jgi:hypothetical protein